PLRSVPQMPTRCTRTSTSPLPGRFGSSIETLTNWPGRSSEMAFIAVLATLYPARCPRSYVSPGVNSRLLAPEPLELDDVAIAATGRHQLGVAPHLHQRAPLEHEDPVGAADRAEAVRDDERGPVAQQCLKAALDQPLARGVEVAGRLIE